MNEKSVFLVSLDDGSENWQVIVFADDLEDAKLNASIAYEEQQGEPLDESAQVGVTEVKPPYYWIG